MTPTGTEARVCQDIAARQKLGIEKYGTTVEANPLPLLEWLRHQCTELLDAAVYCKRAIEALEAVEPKPLQVEAGKWYERRDGKVVGPATRDSCYPTHPWVVDCFTYRDDGTQAEIVGVERGIDLIREVPPPMEKAKHPEGIKVQLKEVIDHENGDVRLVNVLAKDGSRAKQNVPRHAVDALFVVVLDSPSRAIAAANPPITMRLELLRTGERSVLGLGCLIVWADDGQPCGVRL